MGSLRAVCTAACLLVLLADPLAARATTTLSPENQLARDVYRELVEIDTTTATGDTAKAAQAMAARLRAAAFAEADVHVFTPAPKKGNLVARLRGTGARRPLLLLAHIDVVAARREDWSTDPFTLVEKDGWFYGRGTTDDKAMASALVTNLIRYKQEGYRPERDIIVVLSTDEEISDVDELGITWLLRNQRDLIDAEFALNEGGELAYSGGKPVGLTVQTSEKLPAGFVLEVRNAGGHAAVPRKDNAIYRLADGLTRLARFQFEVRLSDTTRHWLEATAATQDAAVSADMRAVARHGDPAAAERLSALPWINSKLRTTCVATMLAAGEAVNALPQTAQAKINCRLLPGDRKEDVAAALVRAVADEQISVTPMSRSSPENVASPVDPALMTAVERVGQEFWPGTPVLPTMSNGASDGSFLRRAGIPTYGHCGFRVDLEDIREHGKNERLSVASFDQGTEYLYRLVKALAGGDGRATAGATTR